MLKSPDLQFLPFIYYLPNSFLILLRSISGLIVICSQSCGPKKVFGLPKSPKTSSQQTCFWRRLKKNTLYINIKRITLLPSASRVAPRCCCSSWSCTSPWASPWGWPGPRWPAGSPAAAHGTRTLSASLMSLMCSWQLWCIPQCLLWQLSSWHGSRSLVMVRRKCCSQCHASPPWPITGQCSGHVTSCDQWELSSGCYDDLMSSHLCHCHCHHNQHPSHLSRVGGHLQTFLFLDGCFSYSSKHDYPCLTR